MLCFLDTIQEKIDGILSETDLNIILSFFELTEHMGSIIFDIFCDQSVDFREDRLNCHKISQVIDICYKLSSTLAAFTLPSPYEIVFKFEKVSKSDNTLS